MPEKNINAGHRQRMKKRFRENLAFEGFAEHEILEMLLYYCYPRGDTNKLAHKLINHFGSLKNVLAASPEELIGSGLVGENPASNLKFFYALHCYMQRTESLVVDGRDIVALKEYISSKYTGEQNERIMLFFVDANFKVRKFAKLNSDTQFSVNMDLRLITKTLLNSECISFFIAHNHPNAPSRPSDEDIAATRILIRHISALDIILLDHFIVGEDGVSSLRQLGLIYDHES